MFKTVSTSPRSINDCFFRGQRCSAAPLSSMSGRAARRGTRVGGDLMGPFFRPTGRAESDYIILYYVLYRQKHSTLNKIAITRWRV
jgi:hypothetical protein